MYIYKWENSFWTIYIHISKDRNLLKNCSIYQIIFSTGSEHSNWDNCSLRGIQMSLFFKLFHFRCSSQICEDILLLCLYLESLAPQQQREKVSARKLGSNFYCNIMTVNRNQKNTSTIHELCSTNSRWTLFNCYDRRSIQTGNYMI